MTTPDPLTPDEEARWLREANRLDPGSAWSSHSMLRLFATLDRERAALATPPESAMREAAEATRDLLANYLWNEDDSGDENQLEAAYDRLAAILGPSTEEGVGQTLAALIEQEGAPNE